MKIELLNKKKHDRKSFDCGISALTAYLQKTANQDQRRDLTRVHVLADDKEIVGFYTLSAHSIYRENLPEIFSAGGYNEVPVLMLGRLAVNRKFQKQGFGSLLVHDAFKKACTFSETIRVSGMVVDLKSQNVRNFYEGLNFIPLHKMKNRLVVTVPAMVKALS